MHLAKRVMTSLVFCCVALAGCDRTSPVVLDITTPDKPLQFMESSGRALCDQLIRIETGWIRGISEDDAESCVWRGVPYAKAKRWLAPQRADDWDGVLDASRWGARCMQNNGLRNWIFNWDPSGEMSEDCLFLNVWRPYRGIRLPVMVFLHGGGLGLGTANSSYYWGDRLAESGEIVYVSLNYRVGSMGFFASPALAKEDANGSVGNYGMLDQIAALRWVKQNVAVFGGDPNNITIFGQSGGSWSVCNLLASPLAEGLFHRAIMQSGGCNHTVSLQGAYEMGKDLAKRLGCDANDLECLRRVPAEDVIDHQMSPRYLSTSFGPTHDGHVLSADPLEEFQHGRFNQVPVIIGYTRDEMHFVLTFFQSELEDVEPESYQAGMQKLMEVKSDVEEILSLYPLEDNRGSPYWAYGRVATEIGFTCPSFDVATAISQYQEDVWFYRIDFESGESRYAAHGMDVPLVTQTLDRFGLATFLYDSDRREAAVPLSNEISRMWSSFARSGNPNSGSMQEWPRFDRQSMRMRVFDLESSNSQFDRLEQCRFWGSYNQAPSW